MGANNSKEADELCSGGKILQTSVIGSLTTIKDLIRKQEESHCEIAKSILTLQMNFAKYTTRDLERIESLEKSRDCKNKKIRAAEQATQELEVVIADHFGEHRATEKAQSRLAAGGLLSGPATVGIFEVFKFLITGRWW